VQSIREDSRGIIYLKLTCAGAVVAKDLGYGDTAKLMGLLAEVSRLLNAYLRAILTPGS